MGHLVGLLGCQLPRRLHALGARHVAAAAAALAPPSAGLYSLSAEPYRARLRLRAPTPIIDFSRRSGERRPHALGMRLRGGIAVFFFSDSGMGLARGLGSSLGLKECCLKGL